MSKTNKLLVQGDYPLIASPTLAQAYGMAAATFLQKLHYCLQNSETKTHQSKKYFFHSYEQWVETLGFYSVSTIKRVISKLKQDGILLVKKLSKNKWLQTNYYAIDYKKLKQQLSPKIGQVEDVSTESMTQSLECSKQTANHVVQTVCPAIPSTSKLKMKIGIAAETYPFTPTQTIAIESQSCKGLPHPLQTMPPQIVLQTMPRDVRVFYHELLQQRVDIHYDDMRLLKWLDRKSYILRHIAYIKESFGHHKYNWHSPEQLNLNDL